jgi:DeoR/GlpR family transcriptional regulator of sugar metabolism
MLREERQNYILNQINLYNKVLTNDLCTALHVSLDTVRRDLNDLEKEGKLVKVHGGAISKFLQQPFQQPAVYAREKKKEIARKALELIYDGMTILAGGGTVMLELAKMIPEDLTGTFFTVSPLVALEVTQRSGIDVILLAGRVSRNSYICMGSGVIRQLSEIRADLCLLGTNGISIADGVTDMDWEVVQVKQQMIRSARKTAILSISEKIGSVQNLTVCNLNAIDYLLTELAPSDPKLEKYTGFFQIK